jgi:ABC-2 type transport system permease protein
MADLGDAGGNLLGNRAAIDHGGLVGPLARAQYGALVRLRWRMFVNSLRSTKGALELGARTFSYLVYGSMGLALGAGAGGVTYLLVVKDQWRFLPIVFWVLAFLWQMIPVMLASFQEQFDLGILLRFPVRFGSYFLLYLVFGLLDISTILGGLCCLGIWIGFALARASLLLWISPALALFALFNILLVRAVFAWIERWLTQRKTREILGAIFMVGLLSMQLLNPALYRNRHLSHRSSEDNAEQLRAAKAHYSPLLKQANAIQKWLPPGLVAVAARPSAVEQPADSSRSLGLLGLYALLAGSLLAVRLKAEYSGENLGDAPRREKPAAVPARAAAGQATAGLTVPDTDRSPVSGQLAPGHRAASASGPIAAILEKDVRALLRTLPLLWAIGAPLLMVLVFSGVFLRNLGAQGLVFPLALPLCMVYAQLGFTQIFYNNLGTEAAGIQLYFLSPTPFRSVLLAKNLFHSCLFALVALLALVMTGLRLGTPHPAVLAATIAWIFFALPCNLTAGNLFSLKMPYRVNPGRISRQRGSQTNALLSLLVQVGFLVVGASVFWLCWLFDRMWFAAPVFLLLAAAAWLVWKQILDNVNRLAFEHRDTLMATLMKEG